MKNNDADAVAEATAKLVQRAIHWAMLHNRDLKQGARVGQTHAEQALCRAVQALTTLAQELDEPSQPSLTMDVRPRIAS